MKNLECVECETQMAIEYEGASPYAYCDECQEPHPIREVSNEELFDDSE